VAAAAAELLREDFQVVQAVEVALLQIVLFMLAAQALLGKVIQVVVGSIYQAYPKLLAAAVELLLLAQTLPGTLLATVVRDQQIQLRALL